MKLLEVVALAKDIVSLEGFAPTEPEGLDLARAVLAMAPIVEGLAKEDPLDPSSYRTGKLALCARAIFSDVGENTRGGVSNQKECQS